MIPFYSGLYQMTSYVASSSPSHHLWVGGWYGVCVGGGVSVCGGYGVWGMGYVCGGGGS